MTARWSVRTSLLVGALVLGGGCRPAPDPDMSRPAEFGFQKSLHTSLVEEGAQAYARYCAGCHGSAGDGAGPAAPFFEPRPRNFQLANFKFQATRSGQLPTDEDLRRTIRQGLKGSAMPPFDLLPARTIDALVAYVQSLSPKWAERSPASPIRVVEDPYRRDADKSQAIARGAALYHGFATCWTCHPAYVSESTINEHIVAFGGWARPSFRNDLHLAIAKPTVEGELIYPPDFRRDFLRSGVQVEDLYRIIGAGITGTAMPTWIDSMDIAGDAPGDPPLVTPDDIWALAYYVQQLVRERPQKLQVDGLVIRERPKWISLTGAPSPYLPSDEDEEDDWDDWDDEDPASEEGD